MSSFKTLHPRIADSILNVDDLAALNTIGDPQLGDIRFVVSEDTLYVYTSGGWEVSGGGGGIQPPDPASSTDNAIVRWDGTDASTVQNSLVTISDAGVVDGATQINVDNLRLDGNTLSATTGDVELDADADSVVLNGASTQLRSGMDLAFFDDSDSNLVIVNIPDTLTGSRSVQLPDASGNIVVDSATQTLSSKTIVVANNTVTTAASGNLTSTELNGALAELQGDIDTRATSTALSDHINDTSGAHAASAIANTPAGNLSATDVQGAVNELQSDVDLRELASNKGISGGYASLDGGGKVPVTQLPASLMTYEGTWDAATNTPTLVNGTGDAGMVYIVSGAGTVNFGAGNITFAVGDWVIYNGTIWQKSDNADDVVSVNGFTGVVTLDYDDVNAVSEMGAVTDNRLVRTNGTTGDLIQQSGITISDTNEITGVARIQVDNIAINGNAVFSTSGDLELDAGLGTLSIVSPEVQLLSGCDLVLWDSDDTNAVTISVPSNITTNRTPQIPDDTGNFVLTTATQTLTNKSIVASQLTGSVAIANGGTGSTTAQGAINALAGATTDNLVLRGSGTNIVLGQIDDTAFFDTGAFATGAAAGTLPPVTSMSNALATQLGYKQYLWNTAYNASVTPSVSSGQAGWSTTYGYFRPYQLQDGSWVLRYSVQGSYTAANVASVAVTITGITFADAESVTGTLGSNITNNTSRGGLTGAGGNSITIFVSSSGNTSSFTATGEARLSSKPTWAY